MIWGGGCKQKWKMGVFLLKKVDNQGCFCKKGTFPQRRVHYVQYQYFILHFTYLGVHMHPTHPSCLWACVKIHFKKCSAEHDVTGVVLW